MEKKLNLIELLKNCPKGMELDCTIYENVEFEYIEQNPESKYPIHCLMKTNGGYNVLVFTHDGCYDRHPNAKCAIFPKGKTTWEDFEPPCQFKDGDVIFTHANCLKVGLGNTWISIFQEKRNGGFATYVDYNEEGDAYYDNTDGDKPLLCMEKDVLRQRFATKEEKQKLFQVIKDNGYKWNEESKTLEKLAVPKFDITTLKPFDKVLVRDNNKQRWSIDLFSFIDDKRIYSFVCIGHYADQCIPYEGNEHLLGTTNNCDEYYKTWK